jgi:DNA helicase-2/ATP-dependent DNA helicase PcrA
MEELKTERNKILDKISHYKNKIFEWENKLVNIEELMTNSTYKEIIETQTLNEQQLEVVNAKDKFILTIAAPGSGKTHTLISTYIKMVVEDKIDPTTILLITFTKKAGQEMCGRLASLIPTKLPAYVGSLHGLAYRVLQEHDNINYTILDENEPRDILKDLCDDDFLKNKISIIIEKASSTYPFCINIILKSLNLEKYKDQVNLIINLYNEKKKKENLLDFNDLLIKFCKFLDSKKSYEYKQKIKVIFFDEYQDVNPIQHYILKKLKKFSRIIVVGDDAQSIYAFRGSSVKFILDFPNEFKPNKMYLLENNYRSSKEIVEFFQAIIKKNTNQYEKNVVSSNPNAGIKPIIVSFENNKLRDQWIINDIIKNKNSSKIVILARKNESLNKIEVELVKQGISVIKQSGLSILDKPHIKDFLAFITILVNDKSSIHWKRILALSMGINTAYEFIEKSDNIRELIKKVKDTQVSYANYLKELDAILDLCKNQKRDIDKGRLILNFLGSVWAKKIKNFTILENMSEDVTLLLNYLSTTNLQQFINELYLNQSIEVNLENSIYLTTIHGSKGLEWDYVYLIDVDAETFPSFSKQSNYLEEGEEIEEERRLFYVACSRAKTNLIITYYDYLGMSPFIREIDKNLYQSIGVNYDTVKMEENILSHVKNYLKFFGYSEIYPILKELKYEYIKLNNKESLIFPKYLEKFKYSKIVINNFINLLITKMIQINFKDNSNKFVLNVHKLDKVSQKIQQNYIDELSDWRNLLDDIFTASTINVKDEGNIFTDLKNILVNYNYDEINKNLSGFINKLKPKEIHCNYNVSHANIKGQVDLLIDDNIIKINQGITTANISQLLINCYLLQKKDYKINTIILFDPFLGEITKFDTTNINFKMIANIFYGKFKK